MDAEPPVDRTADAGRDPDVDHGLDRGLDPAAEPVAVYDRDGAVVGVAPRGEVYARSLWHGVGGVLLRSGDSERAQASEPFDTAPARSSRPSAARECEERVYVHRRSATKLVMPGLHDCWAGGVVAPGEDPATTAARELAEELGVAGVSLTPLFTLAYDEGEGGLRSHLYAFEARYDGPVRHQAEEVAAGGWMPLVELQARLADPSWPFVPDGRMLVERWFAEHGPFRTAEPSC
jgi:8-oxo-dGTP pyrophosphatase MutT (NUDIX family)